MDISTYLPTLHLIISIYEVVKVNLQTLEFFVRKQNTSSEIKVVEYSCLKYKLTRSKTKLTFS